MKNKIFTRLFLAAFLISGFSLVGYSQDNMYHGNSNWDELSDYPLIISENFQDWDYTDADGYGLKTEASEASCATNARTDKDLYSTFTVKRPVNPAQGVTGNFAFYLDFCLILPNCDTQSGTLYTENPDGVGSGDNQGESWANVSVGSLNIYDNYQGIRPDSLGVGGDGSGSLTTSKISKLERVQYTTSSYGKKRGFNLEIGFDLGDGTIAWDTLRYIPGSKLTPLRPEGDPSYDNIATPLDFEASNRGWVFEEKFDPEIYQNVYLRWRPTNPDDNRQIVRIHDIKIYGVMNQSDVVTSSADLAVNDLNISYEGRLFRVSKESRVAVYNLSGILVQRYDRTMQFDLSGLKSGVYIIKAKASNGNIATRKVVL